MYFVCNVYLCAFTFTTDSSHQIIRWGRPERELSDSENDSESSQGLGREKGRINTQTRQEILITTSVSRIIKNNSNMRDNYSYN